jgi:hypothetical protein
LISLLEILDLHQIRLSLLLAKQLLDRQLILIELAVVVVNAALEFLTPIVDAVPGISACPDLLRRALQA